MKVALVLFVVALVLLLALGQRYRLQFAKPIAIPRSPGGEHKTYFVYAKILDPVLPLARNEKYGNPLDTALQEQHLGEVIGGGTMQREDKSIEYVGLDLELTNLDSALDLAKTKLRELGAPIGSALEFQRDDVDVVVPLHTQ